MSKLFAVMIGGAVGAAMRFWLSGLQSRWFSAEFPLGTLLVNLSGSFLIGLLYTVTTQKSTSPLLAPLLITGFLGALTTFSTFSLENFLLLEHGRWLIALVYTLLSLTLGLACVYLGVTIGRQLVNV